MTDILERLRNIRDHLRSGRFGQREVWEKDLDEAADEIVRLRAERDWLQVAIKRLRTIVAQYFDDSDPPTNMTTSDATKEKPQP